MLFNQLKGFFIRRQRPFHEFFSYRPDDVVIVSYPKSGSTWLRFILAHLINAKMTAATQEVDFLRTHLIVPEISEDAQQNGVDFETLPSPRFLRSHELYSPYFPKVVYLLRDGRDVLISYYHHFRKFHSFYGSLHEFITNRECRGVEWNDHVESWLFHNPPLKNLIVVRYEDMLADPEREVKRIVHFSDFPVSDDQIRAAITNSSFESLQRKEEQSGLGYVDPGDPKIRFVRKGQAGEWKSVLSEEEKEAVYKLYGETLGRTSYVQ